MLGAVELVRDGDIWVDTVQCDGADRGWSAEEPVSSYAIVLVRSGSFRRRIDGVELVADPMVGYLECPGSVQQIAHPCGGDTCTAIGLSEQALGSVIDPDRFRPGMALPVAPALGLAHLSLMRSCRTRADQAELAEQATLLAGDLLESSQETRQSARAEAATRHTRLADRVREALRENPRLGLMALARMNGVSMYHLSRVFRAVTGTTLSRHRIRLRASLAIHRIAAGERNLALVAADVGFADQAHMTRTLRMETEMTPARVRSLLVD